LPGFLLVAIGTTVDRMERLASRIDVQTRKLDENDEASNSLLLTTAKAKLI
jgi:hypothetical protein